MFRLKFGFVLALLCATSLQVAHAAPTYLGSYEVDGGGAAPSWTVNPPTYTGQEAAALIFGGLPSDYLLSIDPNTVDPSTITDTAHEDVWGGPDTIFAQDAKLYIGGYNDIGTVGSASSAYVFDHSDANVNYVWLNDQRVVPPCNAAVTPEPCTCALLVLGGLPLALKRRNR